MAQVVFVLGAGASREAGAPLMSDFLDIADNLWKTGAVNDKKEHFEKVFSAIGALQQVHSKAQLDLTNIEPVFATLEMATVLGSFPDLKAEEISAVVDSLKELIVQTLQKKIWFPVVRRNVDAPKPYGAFCELLKHVRSVAKPSHTVAAITFNYDMACDFSMYISGLGPQYSLDNDPDGVPFLKLHGSLNWGLCESCGQVIPWHLHQFRQRYWWHHLFDETEKVSLEIGSKIGELEHCNGKVKAQPVLVPPTWNKSEYHADLAKVWARAAKELKEAEHVFVIGYSLPDTDNFFRYLYALGTVGKSPLKRLWVFNPDTSGTVKARFQSLLGPGALARYQYFPKKFSDAIDVIKGEFN